MTAKKHQGNGGLSKSSAPRILENLVRQAEDAGASDVHLQMNLKKASKRCFSSIFPLEDAQGWLQIRKFCGRRNRLMA